MHFGRREIPNSWKLARLTIVPTLGKDPVEMGSYSSIAQINQDTKFLTDIIAKCFHYIRKT